MDETQEKGELFADDEFVAAQPPTVRVLSPEEYARDEFYNTPLSEETLQSIERKANESLRLVAAYREYANGKGVSL